MAVVDADQTVQPPASGDVFDRAAAVLAELDSLDLDGLSGEFLNDAVERCQGLRARLEAAEARIISRWDAEKCWTIDGAKTGAAWMSWKGRLPIEETRRRVRHARALRALPAVHDAWAAGEIDRAHITTLLGACNPRTAEAFATGYKDLLDVARTQRFVDFKRFCDMWANLADPDGAERDADDERAAREVYLARSFQGMWFGKMTFDPVSGTIVNETLTLIDREMFEADWAEAKQRLGREPLVMELQRTPAQRRADAMVEMAIRARTAPPDGRRPAPLFTVLIDYPTLAGPVLELADRTVITPGTAAGWLTQAYLERIVFDGPSRVIDVGAWRRFFTGALRRAIEVRDRTCFHPTCDEVPQRPEIDHIHEASKGGKTTQTNGRLGCGFHNRQRNHRPDDPPVPSDPISPNLNDPDAGPDPPDH